MRRGQNKRENRNTLAFVCCIIPLHITAQFQNSIVRTRTVLSAFKTKKPYYYQTFYTPLHVHIYTKTATVTVNS